MSERRPRPPLPMPSPRPRRRRRKRRKRKRRKRRKKPPRTEPSRGPRPLPLPPRHLSRYQRRSLNRNPATTCHRSPAPISRSPTTARCRIRISPQARGGLPIATPLQHRTTSVGSLVTTRNGSSIFASPCASPRGTAPQCDHCAYGMQDAPSLALFKLSTINHRPSTPRKPNKPPTTPLPRLPRRPGDRAPPSQRPRAAARAARPSARR